jgi:hypothetical protein
MKAMKVKLDSRIEPIKPMTEACREATVACEEKTEAFLEKKEPTPEETEAMAEPQEVPEEATDEEMIGAAQGQSRDLRLAIGCHGQLKTWGPNAMVGPGRSVPPSMESQPLIPFLQCPRENFVGDRVRNTAMA